ncbi:hypothetical protein ACTFIW_011742 [Dictyostelium discoideum]
MTILLGSLDLQIQNQELSTNLIVSGFNFKLFKNNPQHSISIKFENLIEEAATEFSKQSNMSGGGGSVKKLEQLIISRISESIGLVDYGADPLLNAQLKNWIDKEIGRNLVTILQIQSNTINSLIEFIKKNLEKTKK